MSSSSASVPASPGTAGPGRGVHSFLRPSQVQTAARAYISGWTLHILAISHFRRCVGRSSEDEATRATLAICTNLGFEAPARPNVRLVPDHLRRLGRRGTTKRNFLPVTGREPLHDHLSANPGPVSGATAIVRFRTAISPFCHSPSSPSSSSARHHQPYSAPNRRQSPLPIRLPRPPLNHHPGLLPDDDHPSPLSSRHHHQLRNHSCLPQTHSQHHGSFRETFYRSSRTAFQDPNHPSH